MSTPRAQHEICFIKFSLEYDDFFQWWVFSLKFAFRRFAKEFSTKVSVSWIAFRYLKCEAITIAYVIQNKNEFKLSKATHQAKHANISTLEASCLLTQFQCFGSFLTTNATNCP